MKNKTLKFLILFFAISLAFCGCTSKNNYCVKTRGGVPFIHIDGEPVRARLFYGNVPGTDYEQVGSTERSLQLNFTSPSDVSALLQLNFGAKIKDIYISEITLLDKTKGEKISLIPEDPKRQVGYSWTQKSLEPWRDMFEPVSKIAPNPKKYPIPPYRAEKKNGVLHIEKDFVDMSVVANRFRVHDIERLNFTIEKITLKKGREYQLNMRLRADTEARFEASIFTEKSRELLATNTKETYLTQTKYAAERGINLVTFGIPAFWEDDETCKKLTDSRIQKVIEANPNAKIIVRMGLEPPNWWLDKYRDEMMCSPDGTPIERMHVRYPSPSSEIYRRDAMHAMRKFIAYVEEKYPNNIAGYHPSGGNSSEWFYGGTFEKGFHGYDKATLKAWRKYLAKKYGYDANLQKAWNNPNAKIAEALVPSVEERFVSDGAILDPRTRAAALDFNLFLQEEMSDILLLAVRTIRECSPKDRLCVVFYGYGFGFASVPNGPAYSGHYAMRKLLQSPDIDIFTAPIAYDDRFLGGIKRSSNAAESALMAGKLWLDEDDNRTWLAPKSGSPPYYLDPSQISRETTAEVERRNMAHEALKNMGSWWMDLFSCGWFKDQKLWEVMDEFAPVEKEFCQNPTPYKPEVSISYDEKSLCYIAGVPHPRKTTTKAIYELPNPVSQTGAPHGQYLLDDLLNGNVTPKLNYISGAYALTEEQRIQMQKLAEKSCCVFIWNAGYVDLDKKELSLSAIKETTGFDVEFAGKVEAMAIPTEYGKSQGIEKFGLAEGVSPLFSPIPQEGDKVVAKYPNGKPAILVRLSGKFPRVFVGTTTLTPELCKYLTKLSGAHSYVDNNAVAVANGNYVTINTTKSGKHTISLKEEVEVFDVFAKKSLGRFKTKTFELKKGEVKLFRLTK